MIGKNNRYLKNLKANDHFQSFSIRRLSIGTVSVAIATGVFLGFSTTNSVVQAADNPGQVNAFPNKTVNDTSTKSQETINSNSDSQRVVGESKVNDTQENATQNDTSTPTSSYAMVSERNRSKIQTDSATNSGEAKNGDSSLKNSTFVSNDTLDTKGTSNPFAQNTHSLSSNAVRATTNKLNTNSQINSIPVSKIQNKLLSVPNKARTTGFSVTDPDYPSDMWVDPNPNHYTFFGAEETRSHNQIVLSTDRTGTGIVYVTELDDYGNVIDKYTLDKNSRVMSPNTGVTIYNDDYAGLTSNEEGRNYENLVMKYEVNGDGTRNSHTFSAISFLVPKVNKQVTEYVDKSGKQIVDKNGQTIPPVIQYGLDGQKYTTADNKVIQGYYAETPSNAKGYMSTFGTIGKKYHKDWHNGVTATFTQTGSDGTMSVQMYVNGKAVGYPITLKPGDQDLDSGVGNVYLRSIYIPQTIDIKYVYKKLGKIVPTDPSGKPIPGADTPTYNNDPNDPSKGGKTEVPNIPGYTPERPTVTPDNPGEDTPVIYTPIINDVVKKTSQTIHYTGAGNATPADNVQNDYTFSGKENEATHTTTWSDNGSHNYPTVNTPTVNGYYADKPSAGGLTVTPGAPNASDTVTYKKLGKIVPTDPSGKPIPGADTPTYNNDPNDPSKGGKTEVPNIPGYTPERPTVTPDNPGEDTPVIYTPIINDVVKKTSQTIHYTGAGNATPADNVQNDYTFSGKENEATHTTTWSDNGSHNYPTVNTPTVNGYYADKPSAGGLTVTPGAPNASDTVTYKKLGKIVPTDPSGKPIPGADTPTYNNDPNDPSKGGKTEVPNIPGYTPERPTVTPDNPGEDTSVIYRRIEKTSNPNNDSSTPIAPAKESKTIISSNATKETHKNDHLSLNVRNSTSKLPQTGVSDGSFTSIIGFLLLSLSSLFGLSYSKRKR